MRRRQLTANRDAAHAHPADELHELEQRCPLLQDAVTQIDDDGNRLGPGGRREHGSDLLDARLVEHARRDERERSVVLFGAQADEHG